MKKRRCFAAVTGLVAGLVFLCCAPRNANAQSGSGRRPPERKAAPKAASNVPPFEVRFWKWLSQANYQKWAPPAGEAAGQFYPGKSPHGKFIKTYLNRIAAQSKDFPPGSVIVKENFGKDKKLMVVTVMYKSKGYDAGHKDWWYAKYMPNGQIAMMKQMKIAGKVNTCIQCHSNADGEDYVFAND